ncbi:MAG: CDP-alcohol phosphatidyltransferase family protein [bacterium]
MVPNIITGIRVVLIVPILYCIAAENFRGAALLFLIAVTSDALDGQAARRLGQESVFGGLFDLTADRIIMTPSLLFITVKGLLGPAAAYYPFAPWTYTAIILVADATTIAGIIMFSRMRRRDPTVEFPSPPPVAKAAYPFQTLAVLVALLQLSPAVVAACMYAGAATTVAAFVVYMKKGGFVFKEGI